MLTAILCERWLPLKVNLLLCSNVVCKFGSATPVSPGSLPSYLFSASFVRTDTRSPTHAPVAKRSSWRAWH